MDSTVKEHAVSSSDLREAELLIQCVRGSPILVPENINWPTLQEFAENHGLLPLVHKALVSSGSYVPEFFINAVRESQARSERLATILHQVLKHFARQSIDVMPLKGPMLAELLYSDITMRPCTDIDLLVHPGLFDRAEKLLIETGWTSSAPADDYQHKFVRDGILLELHFDIASPRSFSFDLEGMWKRTVDKTFRGQPAKAMCENDLALYLLLHGLKHGFAKLLWVLDLALALNRMEGCSLRELMLQAREQGLEQAALIGCSLLLEVCPDRVPQSLVMLLAELPAAFHAAQLAAQRLIAGENGTIRDPEIWRLYLLTETRTSKRWLRRASFFQPTSEDYKWTARHRIPRTFALLMRPLRLIAKYGIKRALRVAFPRFV